MVWPGQSSHACISMHLVYVVSFFSSFFLEWPSHPHLPGKLLAFFMCLIITSLCYKTQKVHLSLNKLCTLISMVFTLIYYCFFYEF